VFYATPYPGTRLYDQCLKERLFTEEYFYDANSLVNQVEVGQMVKGLPFIKPYNLEQSRLIDFKKKVLDYLTEKRDKVNVPMSSPLRFSPRQQSQEYSFKSASLFDETLRTEKLYG
jgi:hypothetical protein